MSGISPAAQRAHDAAVADGGSTYIDPETRYMVFTSLSHLERGYCCGNDCRHCPYSEAERRKSGAIE